MSYSYLSEAFKRLNLLEDDYNFSSDAHKVADELQAFVADDIDAPEEEVIIDTEADTENDLQDTYVGKVILECACCHSRIYKDQGDVILSEEGDLANVEETCPVCNTESGFKVIGKIEAFDDEKFDEEEPAEEAPVEEEPIEDELDDLTDDEIEEALKEALGKSLTEDLNDVEVKTEQGNVDVQKDGNKVTIDFAPEGDAGLEEIPTAEEEMIAPLGDDDIASIEGNDEEFPIEDDEFSNEEPDLDMVDDGVDAGVEDDLGLEAGLEKVPAEDELDAELEDEEEDELPNESLDSTGKEVITEEKHICEKCGKDPCECEQEDLEEALSDDISDLRSDLAGWENELARLEDSDEDESEQIAEVEERIQKIKDAIEDLKNKDLDEACEECSDKEDSEELDEGLNYDDFDETKFNSLCTSYLKRVYENANSFKTTECKLVEGALNVTGLIEFESGKTKSTTFTFSNALTTAKGATVLEGMNKTFSNSAKAFSLRGSVVDKEFVAKSMIYNYSTKQLNESNESEAVKIYGRVAIR